MRVPSVMFLGIIAAMGFTESTAVPVEREPFHRPVFSNSEVQVLDVVIPPGATSLFHTHVYDLLGLTIASAPSKNEVQGQNPTLEPADPEGEVWFEPFPKPHAHRVANLGSNAIHYVVFQLLRPTPGQESPGLWDAVKEGKVVLQNARVRVVRIELRVNEKSLDHPHRAGYGLVALTSGRIVEDGGSEKVIALPGFVRWKEPSANHSLKNGGDTSITVFELEIRQ